MKKYICVIISVLISVSLCGCDLWMSGEYLSVTPHEEQYLQVGTEVIEVSNYVQLRNAIASVVESGVESCIISVSSFNSTTAHHYATVAVNYVMDSNPVASYAVKEITFEIDSNKATPVIRFDISYSLGRSEILQIKKTGSLDDVKAVITSTLDNCEDSVVLRMNQYGVIDFAQLVQEHAYANPDRVMEIPEVHFDVYPESGQDRLVALNFTYQTNSDDLKEMQEQVDSVFTSAELYVKKTAQVSEVYSQLYSFLMERHNYTVQKSITPAYSLLYRGVGDSHAFATVYAAMCRRAELDCQVVSGTRDGKPWSWNVVRFRGNYYHVDLLSCLESGMFEMREPDKMARYVWDYS